MDLWCEETADTDLNSSSNDVVREDCLPAATDLAILNHDSVLERLLNTEANYIPAPIDRVYKCVQKEIQLHMRNILATWMSEVSKVLFDCKHFLICCLHVLCCICFRNC